MNKMWLFILLLTFSDEKTSGADHQASSAIASKQSFMSKKYTLELKRQMLQDKLFLSNSEVLKGIRRLFAMDLWVHEVWQLSKKKFLIQLTLVYKNDFFSDENFYHTHTMAWVLVVVHLMLWSKSCCQDRFCAHSNFHTELRTQIWLAHFTLSVLLGARRCAIM